MVTMGPGLCQGVQGRFVAAGWGSQPEPGSPYLEYLLGEAARLRAASLLLFCLVAARGGRWFVPFRQPPEGLE